MSAMLRNSTSLLTRQIFPLSIAYLFFLTASPCHSHTHLPPIRSPLPPIRKSSTELQEAYWACEVSSVFAALNVPITSTNVCRSASSSRPALDHELRLEYTFTLWQVSFHHFSPLSSARILLLSQGHANEYQAVKHIPGGGLLRHFLRASR
ncbi:hypothetical protein EV359DRAFT_86187 [Lentinula novae-zelandiae]|nr:hypothetical protein EV359DRAFT_86187 [Lentinula novae-zelandiae]